MARTVEKACSSVFIMPMLHNLLIPSPFLFLHSRGVAEYVSSVTVHTVAHLDFITELGQSRLCWHPGLLHSVTFV
jgi:hypothetical protein